MRLFALLAVAVLLAGCGGSRWDESWRDAEGRAVDEQVVSSGDDGSVEAVFLWVGWPLGTPTPFDRFDAARTYVRDPNGGPAVATAGPLDTNATLPESARNTGYHLGDLQLWLGKDAREAAYLVEGSKVERWPRLIEPVGSA